jgi:hypothetical protein
MTHPILYETGARNFFFIFKALKLIFFSNVSFDSVQYVLTTPEDSCIVSMY